MVVGPASFLGDVRVEAVQAQRIHLGQPDATGRQVPELIEGSTHELPADLVIKALGFDPEDLPAMFGQEGLEVTRWGTIKIDWRTMMTNLDGVFAAGDIVRGASLVVWGFVTAAMRQRRLINGLKPMQMHRVLLVLDVNLAQQEQGNGKDF